MEPGQPSRTALIAASHRAAHQVLENGFIFTDPLALRILGAHAETAISEARSDPSQRRLRIFIAARSRIAEDAVAAACKRGVRQLVVLGAGLDTYAYRGSGAQHLQMLEVDHPATLAWKSECLAAAGIVSPPSLKSAPIDFERETLEAALGNAGFDPSLQTFFTWLGVVPYLTEAAVFATLQYVARLPGGAHVVFDYVNPADGMVQDEYAVAIARLAARVAALGETFKSQFETFTLHDRLIDLGFGSLEDSGPKSIRERFFPGLEPAASDRGGHIVHAATR